MSLKVFVVVNHQRALELVAVVASCLHGLGHWRWTARKHANLLFFAKVELLDAIEDLVELRSAEVSH